MNEHKWRASKSATGRLRVVTCIRGKDGPRNITLGKYLMDPPKGKQVYPRRFNDGLDYRKANLIICTVGERQRMLPKRRVQTTSVYRGVSFSRADEKWKAAIKVAGKTIPLGLHATEDEAALAYNQAARRHFGPGAYQNPVGREDKAAARRPEVKINCLVRRME